MSNIVTRFAPSPTGELHIGGARTALFNYIFAKKNGGKFILRIEDTDKNRSKKEFEENIITSLKWMGIEWDEKIIQSERLEMHREVIKKLIKDGFAYEVEEDKKEGSGKIKIVRFKNKKEDVTFTDLIRGDITIETESIDDFVIAKDDMPLYHLSVVIDDNYSNVTHIIRGEDHITNTARQILIQRALGYKTPMYAHIALTMSLEGGKLSKRDGSTSVFNFINIYLPSAFINFLVLLGWHPKGDKEIFSFDELVKEFSIDCFQKSGAVYDINKLNWIQSEHIKRLSKDDFIALISNTMKENEFSKEQIDIIAEEFQKRLVKLDEVEKIFSDEWVFFKKTPSLKLEDVIWKNTSKDITANHLKQIKSYLEGISDAEWSKSAIKGAIWGYASENGMGEVLWPFRYSITGMEKSPDPFLVADVIGKNETINRISRIL